MFVIIVDGDERIRESLTELLEAHGMHSPWLRELGRALGVTGRGSNGSPRSWSCFRVRKALR